MAATTTFDYSQEKINLQWLGNTIELCLGAITTDDSFVGRPLSTVLWTITAPGTLSNTTGTAPRSAFLPQPGEYQIDVFVNDTEFSTHDTLLVCVTTKVVNAPPVVDAGPNQTIASSGPFSHDSTVTDDQSNYNVLWTQTSGPGTTTFSNPNIEDPTFTVTLPGTYVYTLTVFDGVNTVSDTVTITILLPPVDLSVAAANIDTSDVCVTIGIPDTLASDLDAIATPVSTSDMCATIVAAEPLLSDLGLAVSVLPTVDIMPTLRDLYFKNLWPYARIVHPDLTATEGVADFFDSYYFDEGIHTIFPLVVTWSAVSSPPGGSATPLTPNADGTIWLFTGPGVHTIRLEVFDGMGAAFHEVQVVVSAPTIQSTLYRSSGGQQDGWEHANTGQQFVNDNRIYLGRVTATVPGTHRPALFILERRPGFAVIPPYATINNAILRFRSGEFESTQCSLLIQGILPDDNYGNLVNGTSQAYDITTRPRTLTSVSWNNIPTWGYNEEGNDTTTPDLSSIMNEIMSHPEWSSNVGDDADTKFAFIFTWISGRYRRVWTRNNGNSNRHPELIITYQF